MVPDGVYAGCSEVDGIRYPAVLNIGFAPTYGVKEKRIETHLIGFNGNLYDRDLTVTLVKKLRDICKFDSVEMLKEQIVKDVDAAKKAVTEI